MVADSGACEHRAIRQGMARAGADRRRSTGSGDALRARSEKDPTRGSTGIPDILPVDILERSAIVAIACMSRGFFEAGSGGTMSSKGLIASASLRIVDASVFPRIPGFFIVTPIYMISEKAADVIEEDARSA